MKLGRQRKSQSKVGAFNQEKALVGAFSVITKTRKTCCETDGSFYSTNQDKKYLTVHAEDAWTGFRRAGADNPNYSQNPIIESGGPD